MFLRNIRVVNFRNYDTLSIYFNQGINIIYGKNGQGKTNLLEAIYYLGFSKSHRLSDDSILIRENCNYFKLQTNLNSHNFDSKLEIDYIDNKKIYMIDDDIIKNKIDFIMKMNVVIFYPDELNMIKGEPINRRRFLNNELSALNKSYYKLINDYNKILKMRNDYLKNNNYYDYNYFDTLTHHFIDKSSYIIFFRLKFIKKINSCIDSIYSDIIGLSNFSIKYKSNILYDEIDISNIKKKLESYYNVIKNEEFSDKSTKFGPHLDDFNFFLINKNLRDFGSQGQQRSAVLALKLSLINVIEEVTGEKPILLLDDVFSELDLSVKNNLLKIIDSGFQVFITATDVNRISKKIAKKSLLIKVNNGHIVDIKRGEEKNE